MLHLSEHAAYGRIEAARASRRFPVILELLADGSTTLTTVGLLAPHLTADNHQALLERARHRSKREVEQIVAALRPLPPVPSMVRRLPTAMNPCRPSGSVDPIEGGAVEPDCEAATNSTQTPLRPPIVAPLAPERYRIQFTISGETHDKLRRAQDLLRHSIPNGDPAAIFDRALTRLVAELERTRLAVTSRPRRSRAATPGSRHVPAAVKREIWTRDNGQCAFVGTNGRCSERGFLEIHHVVPFARGGRTVADNLQLRCQAHNMYEAERVFGPLLVREMPPGYDARLGSVRTESLVDCARDALIATR